MKRTIILLLIPLTAAFAFGQSYTNQRTLPETQLTLQECQKKTQDNYPLVRQYDLIEKSKDYNMTNASKGYLPQFSLSGKATYQSAVTKLPVHLPNITIKEMPKDQYQMLLEVKQNIWDGGEIHSQKELLKATASVDREKLNVDMYALIDRVNQLYFGILLLDRQLTQNQLLQDDLGRTYQKIAAYLENGLANQADLDAVSVEQLNTRQQRVQLESSRIAYLNMLSLFLGEKIAPEVVLEQPLTDTSGKLDSGTNDGSFISNYLSEPNKWKESLSPAMNDRPELAWYDAQSKRLKVQEQALNTRLMPHLGLFVQGAYGNPGLNMLKNEFTPYYVAGMHLSWNFGSLYTIHNDRRLIDNNRRQLETNRDVFLFNTSLQSTQQDETIRAMRKQMVDDDEIIRLRSNIRRAAEAKVANGTMTVTDMLREITSESIAKQTKAMHEVQLLMDIWQLKYTLSK
jgi:hypothetical protein